MGTIARIVGDPALAEDILQEVLVKVWQKADQYNPDKGRLFTWLINIARHAAIDKTRTAKFRREAHIQEDSQVVDRTEGGESYELATDVIGVPELVEKLAPQYREIIDILYFKGYSHREAAKEMDIPLGTLKTRVRLAIQQLKKLTGQ